VVHYEYRNFTPVVDTADHASRPPPQGAAGLIDLVGSTQTSARNMRLESRRPERTCERIADVKRAAGGRGQRVLRLAASGCSLRNPYLIHNPLCDNDLRHVDAAKPLWRAARRTIGLRDARPADVRCGILI
jgi:hypothetical protein